jgi:hypothetical protein
MFWILRFIGERDFISRGIESWTDSLYSHVEMGNNPNGSIISNSWMGAHADGGFQDRALDYCKPEHEKRYAIPVTQEQHAAIMAYAHGLIGTPYNFWDIAGLLLHDRKLNSAHGLICSQSMLEVGEAGGLKLLNVEKGFEYLVTPETLHLSPLLIGACIFSA